MKNATLSFLFVLISFALQAQKPDISYVTPQTIIAGTAIIPLTPVNIGGATSTTGGLVSTIAGNTNYGFINGTATAARFYYPTGVAVDKSGAIFVTDKYNHVIRKITPDGMVSTFAGSGNIGSANGQGTAASFYYPGAVVIDENDNLYVSDQLNMKIRKITKSGLVSTYAGDGVEDSDDGPAATASFRRPEGLALDTAGNLYVAEFWGQKIRKISPAGIVSTVAGSGAEGSIDGQGTAASFNWPCSVCIDASGTLYVAEQTGNKIRKISSTGLVTTFAGTGVAGSTDGPASTATFNFPSGVIMDASGNLLVADRSSNKIRMITKEGIVSTLAGNGITGSMDGRLDSASFNYPFSMAFDQNSNLIVADRYNHEIRKVELSAFSITPALPKGLYLNPKTGVISGTPLLGQSKTDYRISARNASGTDTVHLNLTILGKPTVSTKDVTSITAKTALGNGNIDNLGVPIPSSYGFCWNVTGNPTLSDSILKMDTIKVTGLFTGIIKNLSPSIKYYVRAFAANQYGTSFGEEVSFTTSGIKPEIEYQSINNFTAGAAIVPLVPTNTGGAINIGLNLVTTLAGNTTSGFINANGRAARFYYPEGVAVDKSGAIFVADKYNHVIRKITVTGEVSTFAGSGSIGTVNGQGAAASFYYPAAVAIDANENLYVSDQYNNMIRKISKTGLVTTLAGRNSSGSSDGQGTSASFYYPAGIAVDSSGNVFVADYYNHKIRMITPSGLVTTYVGSGYSGSSDGTGTAARFNYPCGLCIDEAGTLYVADQSNHKIRKITAGGVVTTIAGTGSTGSVNGSALASSFYSPSGVVKDVTGNLYVADRSGNKIRKISPDGIVSTLAGNNTSGSADGNSIQSSFYNPFGLAIDANGNLIVADRNNHEIRRISISEFSISPSLPSGLSFDVNSGIISGTPQLGQISTPYRIIARNEYGFDTTTLYISVIGKPTIITDDVASVTNTSALLKGTLVNLGNPSLTSYGVCWNTTGNPSMNDSIFKINDAVGVGPFSYSLANLTPGTKYYVKAFATNSQGTTFGNEVTFTTTVALPKINYATPQSFTEGVAITPLVPTNTGGPVKNSLPMVSTFSGSAAAGFRNGALSSATYDNPAAVAVDKNGVIYVADKYNHAIRKISINGEVTTFAGTGYAGSTDGQGTAASFNYPAAVAVDINENVYVSDQYNYTIRKITKTGMVSTLAGRGNQGSSDGQGTAASFYYPEGLAVDSAGNVFVADFYNHKIRKITASGLVSTLAGSGSLGSSDGIGSEASFNYPCGLCIDASGTLYVADQRSNKIRKVTTGGVVTTIAGSGVAASVDGPALQASLNYPSGIAKDVSGVIYISERFGNRIRKITLDGQLSLVAGSYSTGSTDGSTSNARFDCPFGIALDLGGNILVADRFNHKIRKISNAGYLISPELPEGLIFNNLTGHISGTPLKGCASKVFTITAVNDGGSSSTKLTLSIIGRSSISTEAVSSISATSAVANGTVVDLGIPSPTAYGFCMNKKGNPTISDSVLSTVLPVSVGHFAMSITNLTPGTTYYIRAYSTNATGTSYGEERIFTTPMMAPILSYLGPQIYTVGTEITPLKPLHFGGIPTPFPYVFTYSGNGDCASTNGTDFVASFANPASVALDAQGNLYVTDANTHVIRKITANGVVSTFAGSGAPGAVDSVGTAASFNSPRGIAVDSKGNVYVADTYNNKIRKITKDGVVTTLAGSGNVGRTNGTGPAANFFFPTGVAVDTIGNVYVADKNNKRLCKITPSGVVTTLAVNEPTGIGDGVGGVVAPFSQPTGVAVDTTGNVIVADYGNNQIYKYAPAGEVSLLAGSGSLSKIDGTGSSASFYRPQGLAVDGTGNVYVAEYSSNSIRKITPEGVVTTLAGISSSPGFLDGKASIARFAYPSGIAVDKTGVLFVADYGNNRIRKIGTANYSISPILPTGLTFDVMTGTISGNPTTAINMTTFTIYAVNLGGSCNTTVDISTLSSPQALNNLQQSSLTIYPNPATNQIGVKGLTENQLLTVYTLTGVKLISKEVSNGVTVDVSNLASGVYLVKVGGQDLKLVKK